ncbi:MAG: M23 family metallopeptidase [Rectinemataceae bacterium]
MRGSRVILAVLLFLAGAMISAQLAWPLYDTGGRQWLSSEYGLRTQPMGGSAGGYHTGIDLACRVGTPVLAVADAEVIVCAYGDSTYGKYMVLRLDSGMDVLYGHLSETWYRRGQRVTRGQTIGLSGNTGASTGPHVHISLMIDPMVMLSRIEMAECH